MRSFPLFSVAVILLSGCYPRQAGEARKTGTVSALPPAAKLATRARGFAAARLHCPRFPCRFKVSLTPDTQCRFGELDAIRLELEQFVDNRKLLFTVEPILDTDPAPPVMVKVVAPDMLDRGFTEEFQLTDPGHTRQLGLYLCKDSGSRGRCRGKPASEVTAIVERNTRAKEADPAFRAPDRIYYFQYLFFPRPQELLTMTTDGVGLETGTGQLLDLISPDYPGDLLPKIREELTQAMVTTRALRSVSLAVSGNEWRVVLPASGADCPKTPPPK